jgi:hypothetical protein
VNSRKIAAALSHIGKGLQLLADGMTEGEKWDIDAKDLPRFAQEIAKAVSNLRGSERGP